MKRSDEKNVRTNVTEKNNDNGEETRVYPEHK